MPIIDLYAAHDLFPPDTDRVLAERLSTIIMSYEGFPPPAPQSIQEITGVYVHRLPSASVQTAAAREARTVRIQILTFPGALDDAAQQGILAEMTQVVAEVTGDPGQAARTFVIITESLAGGWGVGGVRPTPESLGLV